MQPCWPFRGYMLCACGELKGHDALQLQPSDVMLFFFGFGGVCCGFAYYMVMVLKVFFEKGIKISLPPQFCDVLCMWNGATAKCMFF